MGWDGKRRDGVGWGETGRDGAELYGTGWGGRTGCDEMVGLPFSPPILICTCGVLMQHATTFLLAIILGFAVNVASFLVIKRTSSVMLKLMGTARNAGALAWPHHSCQALKTRLGAVLHRCLLRWYR